MIWGTCHISKTVQLSNGKLCPQIDERGDTRRGTADKAMQCEFRFARHDRKMVRAGMSGDSVKISNVLLNSGQPETPCRDTDGEGRTPQVSLVPTMLGCCASSIMVSESRLTPLATSGKLYSITGRGDSSATSLK